MEGLNQAIQNLPVEIQEKIYKFYVKTMLKEKKDQGWQEVHEQILSAPYCELRKQIVKIMVCSKCYGCCRDRCYQCFKNGDNHFLGYPVFDIYDCDEIFLKYI